MSKSAHFHTYWGKGWPDATWLEPYFLSPPGQRWFFESGGDSAGLTADGLEGTEHLDPADPARIVLHLDMWGHPDHGVLLMYEKIGGAYDELYSSKGDLARLKEHVRSLHDTLLPVGLFIPFAEAWEAVKEFMERDGALPKCIEWVENSTLPEGTFPEP